ncbi:MAG TPA: phage terminase large subunit family protein [Verrucomicrobiae bacterium]|nr:phage terminase large subunit family protein [Verrucomicrobiae bacterium]
MKQMKKPRLLDTVLREKSKPPDTGEEMAGKSDDLPEFEQREQNVAPKKPAVSRRSFEEFLKNDARVPTGCGAHGPYSFAGREALLAVVRVIDKIVGAGVESGVGAEVMAGRGLKGGGVEGLCDAELALAGGAQFGKTILELNLAAYCTGQRFRNFGLYLPGDDLVEGIVDSKFRPDVVDQIDWFAKMVRVGKALNKSGKAVNRKGAFLVTDGERKSVGMIRGLGKVPTTFSLDVAAMDEVDDIEPRMMKFVRGRLTASNLRFIMKIGTQRIHGRGMNKAWKDGSQGVFLFECPECGIKQCAEEAFPGIVRMRFANDDLRFTSDAQNPRLTWAGDFLRAGKDQRFEHDLLNEYYLACVRCGAELDRTKPIEMHRQPDRLKQRHWSYRISQLAIGAIDLSQIVARFQLAVADPEEMAVFRCDVLGLPQSTAQALTPFVLGRARSVQAFDLAPQVRDGCTGFGGLDMGDRCWFFAREKSGGEGVAPRQECRRLLAAEKMPAGDVVKRSIALFQRLGLSALFIDERPLVNEARSIALALNGLEHLTAWPRVPDSRDAYVSLPGGLAWDARNSRWLNLKCAVVRFTKNKLGAGIQQSIVFFEEGGQTKFVPCVECNRFEAIDRVVREFLTPAEGMIEAGSERGEQEKQKVESRKKKAESRDVKARRPAIAGTLPPCCCRGWDPGIQPF